MTESQFDTQELTELAALSKRPTRSRSQFVIVGGVIGVLAPCLLALIFNERTWDEYADYYGPGYERVLGLLTEFPVPVLLGGIAGSAAGFASGWRFSHNSASNRGLWPVAWWLDQWLPT